jgi:hypothetical protein
MLLEVIKSSYDKGTWNQRRLAFAQLLVIVKAHPNYVFQDLPFIVLAVRRSLKVRPGSGARRG